MYRMVIWLMMLTLAFSGVSAYAQTELTDAPASIAQGQGDTGDGVACDAHAHDAGVRHPGQPDSPQHNRIKCCARCSVVSVLPSIAAIPVAFPYAEAIFYTAQHALVGRPVFLDPHIPKFKV